MGILAWIVFGLIAGAIAKAIHPGPDPGGWIITMLLGIVGAFVGGLVGSGIFGHGVTGFNIWSFLLAVAGALILLFVWAMATGSRRQHRTV